VSLRLAPTELPHPSRALCGDKALAVKAVQPRPGRRRAGLHDVLMPPPPPRAGRSVAPPVVRPGRPGDGPGCPPRRCRSRSTTIALGGAGTAWSTGSPGRGRSH